MANTPGDEPISNALNKLALVTSDLQKSQQQQSNTGLILQTMFDNWMHKIGTQLEQSNRREVPDVEVVSVTTNPRKKRTGGGVGGGADAPVEEEEDDEPIRTPKKKSKVQEWAEKKLVDYGQKMARTGASPAGAEAAGLAGRGGAVAGEGAAGALGAAAAPVAIIIAAAVALKEFHDAVVKAAKAQQAHNFQYANSSAAMAAVQVQTEIADAFRDRKVGDATAGTASVLADANTRYDDTAAQFEILWSNVKNLGISAALNLITSILEPIGKVAEEVSEWIGNDPPEESEDMAKWMDETKKKTEAARAAGNAWFQRRF